MKNLILLFCAVLVVGIGISFTSAATFVDEEAPVVEASVTDDLFISGEKVTIKAPIVGELFVVGGNLEITQKPARSIFAAGDTIAIDQGSDYNVFAAGNEITIKGDVAHDVYVAGNKIIIEPSANIKGSLYIAGNELTVSGTIAGNVRASGSIFKSNAVIGGDVTGDMQNVVFTGGSIGGDLKYRSDQDATGLDTVTVAGATTREAFPGTSLGSKVSGWLWGALATLIVGAAAILALPKKVEAEMATVNSQWFKSLVWGLAALIGLPILAILLLASVVGVPLAFLVGIIYIALIYAAFVLGNFVVGSWVVKRIKTAPQNLWAMLVAGIIVLGILGLIPIVAGIVALLFALGVVLPAIGAIVLWVGEFSKTQQYKKS